MKALDWLNGRACARAAFLLTIALGFGLFVGINRPLAASPADNDKPPEATVLAQITVTVLPRHGDETPAVIPISDVQVLQGRRHDEVLSWTPAQGQQAGLQLLILIDDSDSWTLSDQYIQLRSFVLQLPPATAVGIAYTYNGLFEMAQNFTADHNAAAKAVRPPLGRTASGSIYFGLVDMYKKRLWRSSPQYPRRAILVLSDGNDAYSGGTDYDTFVADAVADMQASGIQIFSLCTPYAGASGGYRGGLLLEQVSEATGGYPLYSGLLGTPFFTPFLNELNQMLQRQYLLDFQAPQEKSNSLQPIKIKVDAPNVKLAAPDEAYVPGVEN